MAARASFSTLRDLGALVHGQTNAEISETFRGVDQSEVLAMAFRALARAVAVEGGVPEGVLEWTVGTASGTVSFRVRVSGRAASLVEESLAPTLRAYSLFADCLRLLGGVAAVERAERDRTLMMGGDLALARRFVLAFGSAA